ncbi:ABC transporter permease [Cohnella xylanilytica]|uniref:ABC transporter permease n=1 Tax=Cohnella xylanilytica TaxID=557555 RepID=A0A841UAT1_9BACL|nr:ABC transporter permease [Cohnella xylanilytica]MBB6695254.1 ABC transporter permease [Cohnella xylanilytica]
MNRKLVANELFKAFRLKKFYLFMILIGIVEVSNVLQYKAKGPEHIFLYPNGQSLAIQMVGGLPQIMVVFLAIFVADMMADELRHGTVKLTLLRQVGRRELLHAKIVSMFFFAAAMLLYTIVSSYVVGTAAFGWGDRTVFEGTSFPPAAGVYMTLQSALLSLLPYLGFGLLVLYIAIVTANMGITIGVALGLMIIEPIFQHSDALVNYSIISQIYFFHLQFWKDFSPGKMILSIAVICAYAAVFYLGSVSAFRRKDIAS